MLSFFSNASDLLLSTMSTRKRKSTTTDKKSVNKVPKKKQSSELESVKKVLKKKKRASELESLSDKSDADTPEEPLLETKYIATKDDDQTNTMLNVLTHERVDKETTKIVGAVDNLITSIEAVSEESKTVSDVATFCPEDVVFLCEMYSDVVLHFANNSFVGKKDKMHKAFPGLKLYCTEAKETHTFFQALKVEEYNVTLPLEVSAEQFRLCMKLAHDDPRDWGPICDNDGLYRLLGLMPILVELRAVDAFVRPWAAHVLLQTNINRCTYLDMTRVLTRFQTFETEMNALPWDSVYHLLLYVFLTFWVQMERLLVRSFLRPLSAQSKKRLDQVVLPDSDPSGQQHYWFDKHRILIALTWRNSDEDDDSQYALISLVARAATFMLERRMFGMNSDGNLISMFYDAYATVPKDEDGNYESDPFSRKDPYRMEMGKKLLGYDNLVRVLMDMHPLILQRGVSAKKKVLSAKKKVPTNWPDFCRVYAHGATALSIDQM